MYKRSGKFIKTVNVVDFHIMLLLIEIFVYSPHKRCSSSKQNKPDYIFN